MRLKQKVDAQIKISYTWRAFITRLIKREEAKIQKLEEKEVVVKSIVKQYIEHGYKYWDKKENLEECKEVVKLTPSEIRKNVVKQLSEKHLETHVVIMLI